MKRTVREFMSTKLETLSPEDTLKDAVTLEALRKIRHIPVLEGDKLVGIVTDRDLKRAMPSLLSNLDRAEYERVMSTTSVGQIMTKSPQTITPETTLEEAARLVLEKRYGALPVVQNGKLVGIISQTDMLRAFLRLVQALP